eukprot:3936649-Rhodomonas_salina.1
MSWTQTGTPAGCARWVLCVIRPVGFARATALTARAHGGKQTVKAGTAWWRVRPATGSSARRTGATTSSSASSAGLASTSSTRLTRASAAFRAHPRPRASTAARPSSLTSCAGLSWCSPPAVGPGRRRFRARCSSRWRVSWGSMPGWWASLGCATRLSLLAGRKVPAEPPGPRKASRGRSATMSTSRWRVRGFPALRSCPG